MSGLQGHTHGATHAKVTRHFVPDLALGRPENTRMGVEAVTLRKNGSETTNLIQFSEPVLGRAYELGVTFEADPIHPRAQLVKLIKDMQAAEMVAAVETGPAP